MYTFYSRSPDLNLKIKRERLALLAEVETKLTELRAFSYDQDASPVDSSGLSPSARDAALIARVEACFARIREIDGEQVVVAVVEGSFRTLVYWDWQYGYAFSEIEPSFEDSALSTDLACHVLASPVDAVDVYGDLVLELGPVFAVRSV